MHSFMNLENHDDRSHGPDSIPCCKKGCPYVSIFLSVTYFSATAWPISTIPGRKVGTVSAFMNPGNQGDLPHSPNFI